MVNYKLASKVTKIINGVYLKRLEVVDTAVARRRQHSWHQWATQVHKARVASPQADRTTWCGSEAAHDVALL